MVSIRHAQRRTVRLHVPAIPQEPDYVEFQTGFLAVAHALVESAVCSRDARAQSRSSTLRPTTSSAAGASIIAKPGWIHLQECAAPCDKLDALRRRFHDRAQPLLALAKPRLRLLAFTNVNRRADDAGASSHVVKDHRDPLLRPSG